MQVIMMLGMIIVVTLIIMSTIAKNENLYFLLITLFFGGAGICAYQAYNKVVNDKNTTISGSVNDYVAGAGTMWAVFTLCCIILGLGFIFLMELQKSKIEDTRSTKARTNIEEVAD